MIAGVILLLALLNPDRSIRTEARPMPDFATCKRAERAFLAPRDAPMEHPTRGEPDTLMRYALCVTLPAIGRDA